jgi:hypothetical protein
LQPSTVSSSPLPLPPSSLPHCPPFSLPSSPPISLPALLLPTCSPTPFPYSFSEFPLSLLGIPQVQRPPEISL